jgi:hypothetical protein
MRSGCAAWLSFRLLVQSDRMGAVNLYSLYSRHPAAFDEHSCAVGTVLAAHAAIAMSAAREHERADQVEDALRSSREIGMAVGVLMGRGGVTQDEAFAMLHRRVAAPAPDNSPDSRCDRGAIDLSSKRTGSA